MDIREFGRKCNSKHEVYQQLMVFGNCYLPSEADTNSDYIADILQGRKRLVELSLLIDLWKRYCACEYPTH